MRIGSASGLSRVASAHLPCYYSATTASLRNAAQGEAPGDVGEADCVCMRQQCKHVDVIALCLPSAERRS